MTISRGDVKMALNSLRSTRWRSLLTMLGVVIGVASVVTIVSIGEGIKHQVSQQVNRLGKDLITVRPANVSAQNFAGGLSALGSFTATGVVSPLSIQDQQTIESVGGVKLAAPFSMVPGTVMLNNKKFNNTAVIASTSSAQQVLNQGLLYGDFFSDSDPNVYSAVLGQGIANQLFGGQVPLGRSFTFNNQQFVVVGEFNQFDVVPLSFDADFNNAIFIPYSVAQQLEYGNAPIYEILVKPTRPALTNEVVGALQSKLLAAHNGVQNFSILKQTDSLQISNSILSLLTSLVGGIAGISLLVGGIGVMDVMLVSVTERTREIGIRKAIGATDRQILNQFLIEAIMLSLVGGIIGIILSLLVNVGIRITTSLQPLIVWQVVILAVGVSLIVGVIFGIVPALKAARKDPIDSLRYQ